MTGSGFDVEKETTLQRNWIRIRPDKIKAVYYFLLIFLIILRKIKMVSVRERMRHTERIKERENKNEKE